MPKSHRPYAPEFRRQMFDLVRAGRTPEALSREFEPTAQAIWNWVRQADRDEGRRQDGATSAERGELTRLRRENRRLRQERDILAKAAAWFARETAVIPSYLAGPKADTVSSLTATALVDMGLASLAGIFDLPLGSRRVASDQLGQRPVRARAYSYATPKTREAQSVLKKPDGG